MQNVSDLFRTHFTHYASYVILERAIPHILDGLKPVQRRLLWTLFQMDDGKMHKVANIAGRTMALHPHGDAAIVEALVILANKGLLIDTQGNFGNPLTGDPHAAARYIEARLSPLAKALLFNTDLMTFHDSYDGREQEPDVLPAKLPLLLLHGVEGIAVGMTTKIFPHNFKELIQAEIALLQQQPFTLVPDFSSGGLMDASQYQDGLGTITLRVRMETPDNKTLVIKEICPSTTTESLIRSIENAAKRGHIRIDTIQDFSTDLPHIEIKLPRGVYTHATLEQLYLHTECQVILASRPVAIFEDKPIETSVSSILTLHTNALKGYLKKELELLLTSLKKESQVKQLEYLFIKHRLYNVIQESFTNQKKVSAGDLHMAVVKALTPFAEDIPLDKSTTNQLTTLSIRKILCFNEETYLKELASLKRKQARVKKDLDNLDKYVIRYLQSLLAEYGHLGIRKTELCSFQENVSPK